MHVGARVRVTAGRSSGHEATIAQLDGERAVVVTVIGKISHRVAVDLADLCVITPARTPSTSTGVWSPPPFRAPRAGSEAPSRLPSLAGGRLIYPRGLV
jgi:hypothetical protein